MPIRDDDRQRLDSSEFPDPDDSQGDDLVSCPHCRAMIFEESERCPACGQYLSREDAPGFKPWWIVLGVVLSLAVTIFWIWFG